MIELDIVQNFLTLLHGCPKTTIIFLFSSFPVDT